MNTDTRTRNVRRRFWVEAGLAAVATVLLVATLVSKEWIELLTGWDPDGGSGALEWFLVAGFAVAAVVSAVVARVEWRRTDVPAPAATG